MLKVLIVLHNLTYTGAVFSSRRICRVLMENGYEVDVWCYEDGPFKKEFNKIEVTPKIIDGNNIYENRDLTEEIKNYDLLIANTIIVYAVVEIAQNLIPTIWYIREAQNLTFEFFFSDIRRYYALKRAENIYTVSEYAKKYIVENYNPHVRVVHNCVEDDVREVGRPVQKRNSVIKFLAIGTIQERKQFDVFIKAYTGLTYEERNQCEVHFAGKIWEEKEDYIIELLKEVKKDAGIFYHGEIQERKKLLELISNSDVIVVPSKDEACSLVVLEGAMLSKPIIISKNIGAEYMVTPNNGWVFETGSIEGLRDVYRDVLKKKQHLEEMGRCSRKMYLRTSTYELYEKNILKMVSENLVKDKISFQLAHVSKIKLVERKRKEEAKIEHGFSGVDFLPDKKIAIYAAGKAGQAFYQYCKILNYEVVVWVDKNWKQYQNQCKGLLPVENIEKLENSVFDYVCIALYKKELVDEVKESLLALRIENKKIVWVKPHSIP